jgi:hypothetical protein
MALIFVFVTEAVCADTPTQDTKIAKDKNAKDDDLGTDDSIKTKLQSCGRAKYRDLGLRQTHDHPTIRYCGLS